MDDNNTSAAYKIFHYRVLVYIPATYAYEIHHDRIGIPQYGSAEQEQMAGEELVLQQRTLAEVIEYWDRGAKVIFKDAKDSTFCYDWLREHLNNIHYRASSTFNVGKMPPLEDIQKMDNFAYSLFQVTRRHSSADPRQPAMKQSIQQLFSNRLLKRQRPEEATQTQEAEQEPVEEHDLFYQDIANVAFSRGLYPDKEE